MQGIPNEMKVFIYSFHIPLFFFVSGFFFKKRNLLTTLKHKTFQLLVPWCFFGFIIYSCLFLIKFVGTRDLSGSAFSILENFYIGILGNEDSFIFYTIWFLISLFEVSVLYVFVNRFIKNLGLQTLICLVLYILGWFLEIKSINLPYFIDTVFSVTIYYHMGFLFRKTDMFQKQISLKYTISLLILFLLVVLCVKPDIDLKSNTFPLYTIVLSPTIVVVIYYIFRNICYSCQLTLGKRKDYTLELLKKLGRDSLIIFGLHRVLFEFSYVLQSRLLINQILFIIMQVVLSIVIIELLAPLIYKYIPFLVGRNVTKN